jgi:hypothetical protein
LIADHRDCLRILFTPRRIMVESVGLSHAFSQITSLSSSRSGRSRKADHACHDKTPRLAHWSRSDWFDVVSHCKSESP